MLPLLAGYVGAQTRKHLGNTEKIMTSNVSDCFLFYLPKQHILKTEFGSFLASFSFAHPCSIVRNID